MSDTTTDTVGPVDGTWHVDRDDEVSVLRYARGERGTLGIDGAGQLAGLIEDRARRDEPPPLVIVIDVLHAELDEVRQMAEGRPIADWAPWVAAIAGIEEYPTATVAAIPRQATCGGLELALAADIRVASPAARLGVLETRMGLIPGAGGTQRLPELIGTGNAALLVLSGEHISAAEAHRMGLVQLLDDDPTTRASSLAEGFAAIGATVLGHAKRALAAGRVRDPDGFRTEGRAFLGAVHSDAAQIRIGDWLTAQDDGRNPALEDSPLP